jgi:hypothetical protein
MSITFFFKIKALKQKDSKQLRATPMQFNKQCGNSEQQTKITSKI